MNHEFKHPVIGQKAVVHFRGYDRVGTVTGWVDEFPNQFIRVEVPKCGAPHFDPKDVRLLKLDYENNS